MKDDINQVRSEVRSEVHSEVQSYGHSGSAAMWTRLLPEGALSPQLLWSVGPALPSLLWFFGTSLDGTVSDMASHHYILIAITFLVLPIANQLLLTQRSPLLYPVFAIYVVLGIALVLAGESSAGGTKEPFAHLAIMCGIAALCGSALFQRDMARSIFRAPASPRSSLRYRVDALARITVEVPAELTGSQSSADAQDPQAQDPTKQPSVCVVIRDVSEFGIGLYGFPDDMARLVAALSNDRLSNVCIIYRDKSYPVAVDFRWWRGDLKKGECGLRFPPGSGAEALIRSLHADAEGPGASPAIQRLIGSFGIRGFVLAGWAFSLAGLLAVMV